MPDLKGCCKLSFGVLAIAAIIYTVKKNSSKKKDKIKVE
jgi:hypothetical protein